MKFRTVLSVSVLTSASVAFAQLGDAQLGDEVPLPTADFGVVDVVPGEDAAWSEMKPDIGEQIYQDGVRWSTVVKQVEIRIPDETPLRKQLAELQALYASLYSGVELVDLIERTKADIAKREAVLNERAQSFDARMAEIRKQLEELRGSAKAVGVGDELEAMIESAGSATQVKGVRGPAKGLLTPTKPVQGATNQRPTYVKPF